MNIHSGGKRSYIKELKNEAKRKIDALPNQEGKKMKAYSIIKKLKSLIKQSDHSLFIAR